MLEMFSDNILKLINNSVFYNHTLLSLQMRFWRCLTSSCTVILFDVTDYINLFLLLEFFFFFFIFLVLLL